MYGRGKVLFRIASIIMLIASLAAAIMYLIYFIMEDFDTIHEVIIHGGTLQYYQFNRLIASISSFFAMGLFASALREAGNKKAVPMHLMCVAYFALTLPVAINAWIRIAAVSWADPIDALHSSTIFFNLAFFVLFIFFLAAWSKPNRVALMIGYIINLFVISAAEGLVIYRIILFNKINQYSFVDILQVFAPSLLSLLAYFFIFINSFVLIYSTTKKVAEQNKPKTKGAAKAVQPVAPAPSYETVPEKKPVIEKEPENLVVEEEPPQLPQYRCPKCKKTFEGKLERCPYCGAKFNWNKK